MPDDFDLVTGGSGYFGGLLVRHLQTAGRRVRVLDLHDADDRPRDVDFVAADIRDPSAVAGALRGVRRVFHCVAQVPLARDHKLFWSVNQGGTRTLLAAAAAVGVAKVIYLSSSAVYGAPRANPVTEATPTRPAESYGAAKLAGEALCHQFATEHALDVTVIRPRTILGHGRLGIMQIVFELVRRGASVPVLGDGTNRYQFVHADDLATACLLAADRPGPATYNIGAERFTTMRATLEGLIAAVGSTSRVVGLPAGPATLAMQLTSWLGLSPLAPYHWIMYGREMFFDLGRPKSQLGWSPRFGNVEMFVSSYQWYLANRERLERSTGPASPHKSAVREGILRALRWL